MFLASALALPNAASGQGRELRTHRAGEPEGQLLVYYSSVLANSPAGHLPPEAAGGARMLAGFEATYIPRLSRNQRTVGSDKPETTNLAPVFPRPRLQLTLPGDVAVDVSWVPPVRVFGVRANVAGLALTRTVARWRGVGLAPRIAALTGRIEGPFTCNGETAAEEGRAVQVYYASVCYGHDSEDWFAPRQLSAELLAFRAPSGRLRPYLMAGVRRDRVRFDVGVIRPDGSRDADQPILETRATRAYGSAGLSWMAGALGRAAAELYYVPGSICTVRLFAGARVW